jgi:hypothetical protein
MKSRKTVKKIIQTRLSFTLDSPLRDQLLARALHEQEQSQATEAPGNRPGIRRAIMKSTTVRLAAAAVVAIAALVGAMLWQGTSSGIALADVMTRLDQVEAFRFKRTRRIREVPAGNLEIRDEEIRDDCLVSKEYGSKTKSESLNANGERTDLTDIYFNPPNTSVLISHTGKLYDRRELNSFMSQRTQQNIYRFSEAVAVLKEIAACKYESIGRTSIDGIEVEGFRTTDPNFTHDGGSGLRESKVDVKLWIDVKTCLPVRYESLRNGRSRQGAVSYQVVMYDFQWDVKVDASEFEPPPIPDGYTERMVDYREAFNEQAAMEGWRQIAELFGKYPEPESLADASRPTDLSSENIESRLNKSDTPGAARLKEELKGLTEQEKASRLGYVRRCEFNGRMFYMNLTTDNKDPAYYGEIVQPGEADKVLLRWKLDDGQYRVIFGDLHAETVSAVKLAELEKILPK